MSFLVHKERFNNITTKLPTQVFDTNATAALLLFHPRGCAHSIISPPVSMRAVAPRPSEPDHQHRMFPGEPVVSRTVTLSK